MATTEGELRIRPFVAADQASVRGLVLAGLGDHWGTIDETMNPDLDDIAHHYVEPGHLVVVAEIDGRLVGTGTLMTETAESGRLVRMSVAADARGRGIGKRLVAHLLAAATARGFSRVWVETTETWEDAIALYRSCGFIVDGFRDGDIHMYLDLQR